MKISNFKFQIFLTVFILQYLVVSLPLALAETVDLGISPPLIQIDATPPASINTPITVQNYGDQELVLSIQLKPFRASNQENGYIEFLPASPPASPNGGESLGGPQSAQSEESQLIFEKMQIYDGGSRVQKITLGPGQEKSLRFHIGIPKEETLSDYYFSIVFLSDSPAENEQETSSSTAVAGIATNVLLSVGPKEKAQGTIKEFSTDVLQHNGPIPFTLRISNTGRQLIVPRGNVVITNMFGQTVGLVELLPVNILGSSTRRMLDSSQNPEKNPPEAVTKLSPPENPALVWNEPFVLGPYTATLTVALSDEGPLYTKTVRFIGAPIPLAIALVIITLLSLWISKKVRNRLKQG